MVYLVISVLNMEFLEVDLAPLAADSLLCSGRCCKEESIRSRERFPEYIVLCVCVCVYYMYVDYINSKQD